MGKAPPRLAARVILGLGTLLFATIAVAVGTGWIGSMEESAESIVLMGAMAYFLGLGTFILLRAEGNRIGFVFSGMAMGIAVSGLAAGMADNGHPVAYAIGEAFWLTSLGAASLLFLWYPTGRVPSRRWLPAQYFVALSLLAVWSMGLLTEQLCVGDSTGGVCSEWIDNPIGVAGVPNPEFSGPAIPLFALVYVLSIVSLGFRYRAAKHTERLQLKWFLLAGSGLVLAIALEVVIESFWQVEPPDWVGALATTSILLIPVAATIAITRYRLYEIDRIISRTVSYALVVGLLAGIFAVGVVWIPNVLPGLEGSPISVAASTLAVAALFNPLRRRVQHAVDRRFNRSRYDAEQVVEGFAGSLGDGIDSEGLVDGWVGVVYETMQPGGVGVWMKR